MAQLAASMLQGEERTFNVCCVPGSSAASGFALAARVWEPPAADGDELRRVLMWPGKLDNAAVFNELGAKLAAAGFSCVAVDPPGCGMSAHRKSCDYYNGAHTSGPRVSHIRSAWSMARLTYDRCTQTTTSRC